MMGACSSYVDRHDLQCITFISDTRLVYYMSFMTPDYQVRSQSISLTLHRVGACSFYVDRHDLQCITFISDTKLVYYMSFMTPDYQVRSQSISLTLHGVGACSFYVDRHDLQCIIFILFLTRHLRTHTTIFAAVVFFLFTYRLSCHWSYWSV